jgi:hypothetical protein
VAPNTSSISCPRSRSRSSSNSTRSMQPLKRSSRQPVLARSATEKSL